jgi:radical SAM superfamily enzyme YgiQ (UPF0313 family)
MIKVLLISTYELGHQPFGLASPAAWLREAGAKVCCLDLAVQPLNEKLVIQADLIALYLPMHTATRLAVEVILRLKSLNPQAHLCCYGLYAPTNESHLRHLGASTIIGGEFESHLVALYDRLSTTNGQTRDSIQQEPTISVERQQFLVPDRELLPGLSKYAKMHLPGGTICQVGYTEASRGCKHLCRHCPIVPIYNGRFRIVQSDIVLADIRQQVAAGAQHITFGDPDFLNGPGHSMPIIQALHSEFPDLTYDVTIKVEHLLKYDHLLPVLRDSGCLFITSAVEAVSDHILEIIDKGHTQADFVQAAIRLRELDLVLNPTFVTFTPWTTPGDYLEMLSIINELGLIENVAPIQYAIRLLIPSGSRLLELPEVQELVGAYDHAALFYPWQHPIPAMDELYKRIYRLVEQQNNRESRLTLFKSIWHEVLASAPDLRSSTTVERGWDSPTNLVPRLSESWY